MRLLLLVCVAACASPPPRNIVFARPAAATAEGPSPIVGRWQVDDDSRAIMDVSLDGGVAKIIAYTPDDKVVFEMSDVSWDGKRLRATFTYPPTRFTTKSDLELVDKDTLEGPVTGAYEGFEVWHRVKESP